jgi:hypothetical protein
MNRHVVCVALCCIHLLVLAVSTYIAATDIRSVMKTGWLCSISGLLLGLTALMCERRLLAYVGLLTPAIAVSLFVLEGVFWDVGPAKAALPFGMVLVVNQFLSTVIILNESRRWVNGGSFGLRQLSIRMLMVSMVSFSVFFSVLRILLERHHNWMMGIALGLLGIAFVGLSLIGYVAVSQRLRNWWIRKDLALAEEPS